MPRGAAGIPAPWGETAGVVSAMLPLALDLLLVVRPFDDVVEDGIGRFGRQRGAETRASRAAHGLRRLFTRRKEAAGGASQRRCGYLEGENDMSFRAGALPVRQTGYSMTSPSRDSHRDASLKDACICSGVSVRKYFL